MDYIALGKRLRSVRRSKGITQAELAKAIGRSTAFVGHIERGSRKMSLETMAEIVEALDCSADYLLGHTSLQQRHDAQAREILDLMKSIVLAER